MNMDVMKQVEELIDLLAEDMVYQIKEGNTVTAEQIKALAYLIEVWVQ